MTTIKKLFFSVLFLGAGVLTTSGAIAQDHTMHHEQGMAMDAAGSAPPVHDIYAPAMEKMHKYMMIKPSGDPDTDFMRGMLPHHQGAVDMAKIVLDEGKDPEVRKLAQDVIASQEKEIAFMKAWLAKKDFKHDAH